MPDKAIYVFLDFDDTLSDMRRLRPQLIDESAELLARFGATREAWAQAVALALDRSVARYTERFTADPTAEYVTWLDDERTRIGEDLFAAVGVAPPPNEPLGAIVKRMTFDALAYCNAAFPNAENALRELFEMGVRTQTASAQDSDYLLAALIGARLESYTESKFGPDLINCAKESPHFYTRVFSACGIHPGQAIVVDDQPICLRWAQEAGAHVVHARVAPDCPPAACEHTLTDLRDLPDLVRGISP